jgi:hypothetical protein
MTPASKPIGISRLLPGLDFGLLLIVLTCGTAGLQWLTTSSEATTGDHALLPTSSEALTDQLNATQKELERLRRELDRKQAEAARLRKELEQAETESPDLDSARAKRGLAEQDLEKLRQTIERLDKELHQLQQQERDLQQQKKRFERLREEIAAINKRLAALRAELNRLKRENEALPQEIARLEKLPLHRSSVIVDFTPRFTRRNGSNAVCVKLSNGTVAAVREPYYTLTKVSNGVRATPARPGEAVDRALAAGSDFHNLLDEIAGTKKYVFFLVDSSAFATYRRVREALRHRNIPFGWDPTNAGIFTFVASGGTDLGTIE